MTFKKLRCELCKKDIEGWDTQVDTLMAQHKLSKEHIKNEKDNVRGHMPEDEGK